MCPFGLERGFDQVGKEPAQLFAPQELPTANNASKCVPQLMRRELGHSIFTFYSCPCIVHGPVDEREVPHAGRSAAKRLEAEMAILPQRHSLSTERD